jgi:uncharacterized iron-regulated protein
MLNLRSWWLVGAWCVVACAAPKPAATPAAVGSSATVASSPEPAWLTSLDRDNTLVGKIWDVKANAFVERGALLSRLAATRIVLLGEQHDNSDHHRLQGGVLASLVEAGRRPAVVLEMLEVAQQGAIDAYVAGNGANAAGFGAALGWEKTSWPPFKDYRPIFEAAFAGHLTIVAGNLAQADAKALVKQGTAALPPARVKQLRLDREFPEALEASLIAELRASHCGQLPEALLQPMALAQHARDAQMAEVLAQADARSGAVLIAGGGHARLDRAVPYYLALDAPGASVASVVFSEVRHDATDPRAYVAELGPFDYVWFTPRGSDDDPCAAFHPRTK